ncbi:unnamed protein product [Ilex paraguariensis]|uniref:J domain-containing protein n=1 Tax=Ilex paraguariensis TaxID=185542 RepID=A0ABC8TSX5_9AQUA
MNRASKAALIDSQVGPLHLRAALFHSTPVLERRRRTHWDSRCNAYSKRFRKLNTKQTLLRNVSEFAEHLFQRWQYDHEEFDPSSRQGSSWFRQEYQSNGSKGSRTSKKGPQSWNRKGFQFCEDDDIEVETIFRSAFGGNRHFYWSFTNEEPPQWRHSSEYSNSYRNAWKRRLENEDEYDSSTDSDCSESDLTSERIALGLSVSGPLSLEDVKNAYRACALKWHPDRHQGSSKAIAEEKFKVCSTAYQSLCDKLVLN